MDWKYENGRIYSADENGNLLAKVSYTLQQNGEILITEVYVTPELRGKGIAGEAMLEMTNLLKEKGLKASATCSYAIVWLKKNKQQYQDIISPALDSEAIACSIDTKH